MGKKKRKRSTRQPPQRRISGAGESKSVHAEVGALVKLGADGFTLKVVKKGDEASFPKSGDSVTVHYVATGPQGHRATGNPRQT